MKFYWFLRWDLFLNRIYRSNRSLFTITTIPNYRSLEQPLVILSSWYCEISLGLESDQLWRKLAANSLGALESRSFSFISSKILPLEEYEKFVCENLNWSLETAIFDRKFLRESWIIWLFLKSKFPQVFKNGEEATTI